MPTPLVEALNERAQRTDWVDWVEIAGSLGRGDGRRTLRCGRRYRRPRTRRQPPPHRRGARRHRRVRARRHLPHIGEFLRYADRPPRPPRSPGDGDTVGGWTAKLADALAGAEVTVRQAYPVGNWTLDLVLGNAEQAIGVVAEVRTH